MMVNAKVMERVCEIAEEIATGKRKTVKFKSIQDLDRIISSYDT